MSAPAIVLCVACNPADSLCFSQWLTNKGGYHLIFWESREGFDLDSTRSPAVVLLGSGADLGSLVPLGRQWPQARVVVLLSPEQEAHAATWLSQGADDYLISNQFSEIRLMHMVQRLVTRLAAGVST